MSDPSLIESKIPIIYYNDYEDVEFYDLQDFRNIDSKCPKCLNNTDTEYCSG